MKQSRDSEWENPITEGFDSRRRIEKGRVGKSALSSSSGGNPISGAYRNSPPSGGNPISGRTEENRSSGVVSSEIPSAERLDTVLRVGKIPSAEGPTPSRENPSSGVVLSGEIPLAEQSSLKGLQWLGVEISFYSILKWNTSN